MYSPISYVLPAALFFILSPNILLRLPKNGSKYLVALVHSIIFAILLHFLMRYFPVYESFEAPGIGGWVLIAFAGLYFLLMLYGLWFNFRSS
jgi:hypothetical protein